MRVFLIFFGSALLSVSTVAGPLVQFRTPHGEIDVELFDQDKPITVQNFFRYVHSGAYSNLFFHRWVPGFVLQGGGYVVVNRGATNASVQPVPVFGAISNEFSVGKTYSNVYGTLAMARVAGQTNSASSQWFFNLTNNAFLDQVDGGFTVFGRVVVGTNVLNQFFPSSGNGVYQASALALNLNELPVTSDHPTLNDLLFVDISLWDLQIAPLAGGGVSISWNDIVGEENRVEFTESFPPLWQTLVSTNGRAARFQVEDRSPNSKTRFYRVRMIP